MKRLLSVLLVAAMLLSILPATALATSAELVEYVYLVGLPEEIAPGAAQLPDVQPAEGQVTITEIRWLHENQDDGVPVTAFEEGNAYLLSITLEANEGYTMNDWLNVKTDNKEYDDYFIEDMVCTVLFRYSMLEDAGEILVQINEPREGMEISALTATVTGNAILDDILVYDANTGEEITEGTFAPKKNYQINYTLKPKEGYEFSYQKTTLEVNDGRIGVEWYTGPQHLFFPVYFSTCEVINTVNLTLSDILPGVKREDVTLTAPQSVPYVIESYGFEAYDTDEEWDTFQQGYNYNLHVSLLPKDGYVFSPDTLAYVNGEEVEFWSYDSYIRGNVRMEVAFGVDEIWLWTLPDEIQPGTAELPAPECNGQVEIIGVQWVNEAKQPVTAFEEGNVYYLALTVEAEGVRNFGETPIIETDWNRTTTFEKLSDKKAVIYLRYSLEPDVGAVDITVSGAKIGDKLADVEVEIDGNAIFGEANISVFVPMSFNSYTTEEPDSDVFEAGKIYLLECDLQPKPGYRFGEDIKITVGGKENYEWRYNGDHLSVTVPISTCQELDTVTLTMPEIKVGKAFSDLQVKVPTNAKYTATVRWVDVTDDWNEATGKVQAGHRYEAEIILQAKDGYIFAEDVAANLNGKKIDIGQQSYGCFAVHWMEQSFLTPITKVELPAMPTSIQKGEKLPIPTVSGKNYTLNAFWYIADGGEVTKAEEDGVYLLVYTAEPTSGYEFTEDTKFYIGGKEVWPLEMGWRDAQFLQNYNIGISEINEVSFLAQEPEVGQPAPEVTVPEDADYSLSDVTWGQSATNNWRDIQDDAKTLAGGLYTFVYGMLEVKDGKALASKPSFYLNGQKTEPTAIYNFGQYAIVLFSLGKLGEVEKLTAPALTKDGEILSWNAVTNATGYEIYRATSKSGKYTKVATVTETTWGDSVTAGKTYYYKVKAIYEPDSSKNSGFSSVVSIAYKCDAPVITVVNGDTGKPVISWEKVEGAKKYTVYRATSESGKYSSIGSTTKLSLTDTKAKAGTTYFYKVIANASKSTYNSGYSNIVSCGVICGTPSVTVKIDAATGKPSLSWAKVEGAASYRILRQLPGEETFTEIAKQTGTTFADTTAPIDTVCQYQVQALGKTEELDSAISQVVQVTSGIARPAMKATVDAVSGKPTLTWEAVEGAVKYEIYRSTKSTKGYTLLATVETTSYADESVAAGKTYYYKMVAIGEVSKSTETACVKLTGKCAVPTITVENGPTGKPVISWEKIAGASKYTVYRATSENGKYTSAGTSKTQSFTDTKAKAGTTYFYKVIANASSSKNNSGYSNIVSCGVICGTPSVTVKIDAATGKPSLSWAKVEGAASYRILRQLPGEETFTEIAKQTGTTFADTTAPIDTVCRYQVQALGKTEELDSAISQVVQATSGIARPAMKATVDAVSGKPTLTWEPVEGAVKYEIYRSTKSTKGYTLLATVETTSYADESVAAGKTYYYKMVAIGEVSKSTETACVKLTGKCAAPTISVQIHETSGKPVISWEKIAGASKYTIYRATSENGKYKSIGTSKTTSYTDSKAVPGTEYYYKVVANGSKSSYNSTYSNVTFAVGYAAQPQITLKNDSKGKPVISWKKISEADKYVVVYVDITDVEDESQVTEQFVLDNLQYVEVSKKKTSVTLTQAQTGRLYMVCVVVIPKNEAFFNISQIGYVAATCAAPKISGKYLQGYNCGTWKAVDGAESYAIYRSTKANGEYELLGYIDNDSSFVDLSAVKGKTYYYKVTACTEYTESAFSNYIKLKTK